MRTTDDTAYRTTDGDVIAAWQTYQTEAKALADKRAAVIEAVGRNLYVNRSGFGHGTRVTGFERFDSDKDGDLLHHDGCLIVSSRRGGHNGLIVPNLRRKSGKEFATELEGLTSPKLDLPGMPAFHLGGNGYGGMSSFAPALWEQDGTIYALWGVDTAPVDTAIWDSIPLSVYYTAEEAHNEHQDEG